MAPRKGSKRAAPPKTAWKKGTSPNPGGRPKAIAEVKELARTQTVEAIEKLITLMRGAEKPGFQGLMFPDHATQLRATEALLDRAWGRPTQALAGDSDAPPIRITAAELDNNTLAAIVAQGVKGK